MKICADLRHKQVDLTPNPESKEVPRDELARMSESLMRSFKQALEPEYQVISQQWPDMLRVRIQG